MGVRLSTILLDNCQDYPEGMNSGESVRTLLACKSRITKELTNSKQSNCA
jgi:hypothetical protein